MNAVLDALKLLPPRVRASDLAPLFGVSQDTVLAWGRDGTLPTPTRTGKRLLTWDRDQLAAHIQQHGEALVGEPAR